MNSLFRNAAAVLLLLLFPFVLSAETQTDMQQPYFQITEVRYDITGSFWHIRTAALEKLLHLDTYRLFKSEAELAGYLAYEELMLKDNRNVQEDARITYEVRPERAVPRFSAKKVVPVAVTVHVENTKTFVTVPYPKFSSSSGIEGKLKIKDTNFLGGLYPLEFDTFVNYPFLNKNEHTKFGFDLTGGWPFKLHDTFGTGWFNGNYTNTLGTDAWERQSGFMQAGTDFLRPLSGSLSLTYGVSAGLVWDTDYHRGNPAYDARFPESNASGAADDFPYLSVSGYAGFPLQLALIENFGRIVWTPELAVTADAVPGSSGLALPACSDLTGPDLSFVQTLSAGDIHWKGNFRDGIHMSLAAADTYDIQRSSWDPYVLFTMQAHRAFKNNGISFQCTALAGRTEDGIGMRSYADLSQYVRGIAPDSTDYRYKAGSAVIVNADFPVRVFSTQWFPRQEEKKRLFDFEVQLSPFVEAALGYFNMNGCPVVNGWIPANGLYTAGFECIVYPLKFRSLQLRASFGTDLTRTLFNALPGIRSCFNTDWRTGKATVLTIGIGLFY